MSQMTPSAFHMVAIAAGKSIPLRERVNKNMFASCFVYDVSYTKYIEAISMLCQGKVATIAGTLGRRQATLRHHFGATMTK
jgi:hypothetical protein